MRRRTLVDVRRVGLLSGLGALLLVTRWGGGLLASLLLLGRSLASWCLAGGGWGLQKTRQKAAQNARKCESRAELPWLLPLVPFRIWKSGLECELEWWMRWVELR